MYQAVAGTAVGAGVVGGLAFTGAKTGMLAIGAIALIVTGLLLLRLGNGRRARNSA